MGEIAHRRSPEPDVNYLAPDVVSTEQGLIAIMTGRLDQWGEPHSSAEPALAWMGAPPDGPMPGMATEEEETCMIGPRPARLDPAPGSGT